MYAGSSTRVRSALGLLFPGKNDVLRGAQRPVEARIHINQVGFLPGEPKRAVVSATAAIPEGSYWIVDDSAPRAIRYTGDLGE